MQIDVTGAPLRFRYTNYRGEHSIRRAWPIRLEWGSNEWHPEPQWLLLANDIDKGEPRYFALRDMSPAE